MMSGDFDLPARIHRPWLYALGDAITLLSETTAPMDRATADFFRSRKKLGSRDRRFLRDAIYAWARARLRFDEHIIMSQVTLEAHERAGALFALEFGATLDDLPISEDSRARIQRIIDADFTDPEDAVGAVARSQALPKWLIREWFDAFGDDVAAQLAESIRRRAPVHLRANRRAGSRDELLEKLHSEGVAASPTKLSPIGVTVPVPFDTRRVPSFAAGWFEVQDEGSQLLALAAVDDHVSSILDFCAGAGGKSLALADVSGPNCIVQAHDVDPTRLARLRPRLLRSGHENIRIIDAEAVPSSLHASFDVVLVDAPCTGLGTLRRNPDKAWAITEDDVASMHELQTQILCQAAPFVRPGGLLVYGTCSLHRFENQDVVSRFVTVRDDFLVESVPEALRRHGAPVVEQSTDITLRPDLHGTDGFYIARLRRSG